METDAPNQENDAAAEPPPVSGTDDADASGSKEEQGGDAVPDGGDGNAAAEDPSANAQVTDNQEPQADDAKEPQEPDSQQKEDQKGTNDIDDDDAVADAQQQPDDTATGEEEPKNLTDDVKDPGVDDSAAEQAAASGHVPDDNNTLSDQGAQEKNSVAEPQKPDADLAGGQPMKENSKARKDKGGAVPEKDQKAAGKDAAAAAKEKKAAPVKRGGQDPKNAGRKDNKSEVTHEKSLSDDVDLPEVHAIEISSDPKMDKEMRAMISDMSREKDWIIRASALRRFQSIMAGGAVGTSPIFLKAIKGSDFAVCVQNLFTENRSHLIKETADAFTRLAEAVQSHGAAGDDAQKNRLVKDYEGFLADVVLAEALKTAVKTNVVISSAADACIRSLISNVHSPKLLRIIVEPLMDPRANTRMRQFCSDYLVIVLQSWALDKIEKQSFLQDPSKNSNVNNNKSKVELTDAIEQGIRTCLSDAGEQTRANGRTALHTYESLFPDRSAKLRENLTRQQVRSLNDEGVPRPSDAGMCICVYAYVYVYVCMSLFWDVYMFVCMHVCLNDDAVPRASDAGMRMCMCVCVCMYVFVLGFLYPYTHAFYGVCMTQTFAYAFMTHTHQHTLVHFHKYVCINACTKDCVRVRMYMITNLHTHTNMKSVVRLTSEMTHTSTYTLSHTFDKHKHGMQFSDWPQK
jgi:hypothetical protein